MTESHVETAGATTTRRAVLAGAGVLGASTLLAACGTDDGDSLADGGGTATGGDSGATAAPTATTGAPSGGDSGSTGGGNTGGSNSGGSNSGGTVLANASDIPEGGGKVFKDQGVVVTQPAKGTFKGFTATCTHAGCTVATVQDGTINCGCHGSRFSVEDGSVTQGPASQPLNAVAVKVDGGKLTLS